MSLHTCQNCGQERDAAALDLIDTPRGTMILCRNIDGSGECITPSAYRVVMRYADTAADGFTVFDMVRVAATEREAVEVAARMVGKSVRHIVDDYRTELRRVMWIRAEGLAAGEWVPVSGELRAVTA